MQVSSKLLEELESTFSLKRVLHAPDWESANRIMGQHDVVEWIIDKQDELNRKAIDGGDHQVTIKHN